MAKPELKITVFSDYICPFCYVGNRRINRLREHFNVLVNWCHVEIHPETPNDGQSVSDLGYSPEQWSQMMSNLEQIVAEENLPLAPVTRSVNSHQALLLAEAAKEAGHDVYYRLHEALFDEYFAHGNDIGDPTFLRELAQRAGMTNDHVARAWGEQQYAEQLQQHLRQAAKLGISAVPTTLIGTHKLSGAVSIDDLIDAANTSLISR